MKRKARRPQLLVVSALGLAIAAPMISLPASASLDGGAFLIHAEDAGAAHTATAGLGSRSTIPAEGGGGGGVPVERIYASYQCGALQIDVTQEMVDFSKVNEDLFAQGRYTELKFHSGGWMALSHYDAASGTMKLGFPEGGTKPRIVHLGTTMDIPNVVANPDDTEKTKLMFVDSPEYCSALDLRTEPVAGKVFYTLQNSNFNEEVRYLQTEGGLKPTSVKSYGTGKKAVFRKDSPSNSLPSASIAKPYSVILDPDGAKYAEILMPSTVDGSNYAYVTVNPDGSGSVQYGKLDNFETLTPVRVDRGNSPVFVGWDAQGKFAGAYNLNGAGGTTVAEYNAATGQTWNGSYIKATELDLTVPFLPSLSPR